jgi:hypothetical protein
MSDTNGTTPTATSPPKDSPQQELPKPSRLGADRAKVYKTIERSLGEIVWEATHQANCFMNEAGEHRGETTANRYAQILDAAECLEIALTHLSMLKTALAFRLCTEDDRNIGPCPF